MKREFLKNLGVLTDEQIDAILAEENKTVTEQKNLVAARDATIAALTTERDGLKQQVTDLGKDIKDLQGKAKGNDDLSRQLGDLQTKYDADTKALQDKLDAQRIEHATEKFFSGVEFTSALARRAAMSDFSTKGYKLKEDGTFEGADGYFDQLRKDDPTALKAKETDDGKGDDGASAGGAGTGAQNPPKFTGQMTNGGKSPSGSANPFNFKFTAVRNNSRKE